MANCSKCGYEISDNSKFCPKCGSPIKTDEISKPVNDTDQSTNNHSTNNFTILIITIVVIVTISLATGIFFGLRYYLSSIIPKNNNVASAPSNLLPNTPSNNNSASDDKPNTYKDPSDNTQVTPKDNGMVVTPKTYIDDNTDTSNTNYYNYTSDFIFPYSDSVMLSDSDVAYLDKGKIRMAINEIYARHGYIFHQHPYVDYFNAKSWYHPDSSFKGSDSELNRAEVYNIQLLLKYEKSK